MSDYLLNLITGRKKKDKLSFQEHISYIENLTGKKDLPPIPKEDEIEISESIEQNLIWLDFGSLVNSDDDYSDFEVPVWDGNPLDSNHIGYLKKGQKVKVLDIDERGEKALIQWQDENGIIHQGYIEGQFLKSQFDPTSTLAPVLITPTIHIQRIKELIKEFEGFSGVRKGFRTVMSGIGSDDDIKSEIVLMLASFDSVEEYRFLNIVQVKDEDNEENNEILADKVCNILNARQLARGIARHNYSLATKLDLLGKTGDTELEYQEIRPLLLNTPEGIQKDTILRTKLDPDDDISIEDLKKDDLSSIKNEKEEKVSFDDQLESTDIIPSQQEKELLLFLSKRNEVYRKFKKYDQKLFVNDKFKSSLEADIKELGYDSIESFEKDIESKKQQYIDTFQIYAIKTAYMALDESERALKDQSGALLKKGAGDEIKKALKNQESLYNNALESRIRQYTGNDSNGVGSWILMIMDLQKDAETYSKLYQSIRNDQILLRQNLAKDYPIFLDPQLDIDEIYEDYVQDDDPGEDLVETIRESLISKFENIEETRKNLREDPDLIWKLKGLIELTKARTNPFHDEILNDFVDEKVEDENSTIVQKAILALSIGTVIISFGTTTPLVAATAAGIGLAASAADLYITYQDYKNISPASNTALDPNLALSREDPSVLWVILSAAGTLGDIAGLVKVVREAEVFTQLGQLSLRNISSRKNALLQSVQEAIENGKLLKEAYAGVEKFFDVMEAVRSVRHELAQKFLGKIGLDEFNLGFGHLLLAEDGKVGAQIVNGELKGESLFERFQRSITEAALNRRSGKALGNIAQTGKSVDTFEKFIQGVKATDGALKDAYGALFNKMAAMAPEKASEIADFLVHTFGFNPHRNEWAGFFMAATKNISDPLELLETARRLQFYIPDHPELFIKAGEKLSVMGMAEKNMFMRNMKDIFSYIHDPKSLFRQPGLLDELITDVEVQNFIRYNMDSPERISNLWKSYEAKPEGHSTFRSYIDKFEAERLSKIQKIKGEYPINAQDYAGKTFSFNLYENRIMFDRINAITDEAERARRFAEFDDAAKVAEELGVKGIKFDAKGFPDFSPLIFELKGKKLRVDIGELNPGKNGTYIDIANANKLVKEKIDPTWIKESSEYTWHHIENSTELILIPTDIHQLIRHIGGRGTM